jgi:hypothetical protein
VGIILVAVVVVASAVYGAVVVSRNSNASAIATATTAAGGPAATATPTVIYSETFASSADGWSSDSNCFLGTGGYHIIARVCFAPLGTQADDNISVQTEQISGDTQQPFGLAFRHVGTDKRYDFMIDAGGHWWFEVCTGQNSDGSANCHNLVKPAFSRTIHGGLNTFNTLEAAMVGTQFTFFINGTMVGKFSDSTYSSGGIGLAGGFASSTAEFVFKNLRITAPN